MPLSKERLEARLAEVEGQAHEAYNKHMALLGVIADIKYWLAELEKPEETPDVSSE